MLTLQECFDRAYLGVINQGHKSSVVDQHGQSTCQYRGPNGAKCAVGHLILDEHIGTLSETNPSCPGSAGTTVFDQHHLIEALKNSGVSVEALPMLSRLQTAHDAPSAGESFIEEFKQSAFGVAKLFSLNVPDIG